MMAKKIEEKVASFFCGILQLPLPWPWAYDQGKGLQGCGPRVSPGITFHVCRSVRECEGMNPHTPK
jgi:hypothetical protein